MRINEHLTVYDIFIFKLDERPFKYEVTFVWKGISTTMRFSILNIKECMRGNFSYYLCECEEGAFEDEVLTYLEEDYAALSGMFFAMSEAWRNEAPDSKFNYLGDLI